VKKWPKVSIIIVNWNSWKDTIECLESLQRITYPNYEIILVDNGSKDESIEKIKKWANGDIKVKSKFFKYNPTNKPIKCIEYDREEAEKDEGKKKEITSLASNERLIIIKNEKNYGFAEGNNIGIKYTLKVLNPDYVLMLNNDTVVDKKFLTELVKVAEGNEKIGIVGPKIYFYDRPANIQSAGGKISFIKGRTYPLQYNELDSKLNNELKKTEFVCGCAMLIHNRFLQKFGLFDPSYFSYWEDVDLSLRIRKEGYELFLVPQAKIWHKGSASTGGYMNPYAYYYSVRNAIYFVLKYGNIIQCLVFLLYFLFIYSILVLGYSIVYRKRELFFSFIRAVFYHIIPKVRQSRRR